MLEAAYCDRDEDGDPNIMAQGSRLGRTNAEVLDLIDPRRHPVSIDFEYPIYHHFDWDHCAALGVDFPDLARAASRP